MAIIPIRPNVRIQRPPVASEQELLRRSMQRLASNVKDEAHWQQVLANAPSDEHREELERVVGPMLTFRREAPCTTQGCESGKPGVYQPVLLVASPLDPNKPSWVPIELRLCEDCKEEASVEHFQTEAIWSQILQAWPDPTAPPIRRLTTLQWDRTH